MKYNSTVTGKFISRPNRFIAMVEVNGNTVRCHVKNTGRCKEILMEGAEVVLVPSDNGSRTTAYDLVAVYKGDLLINIDSQAPNAAAIESIGKIIGSADLIKPEYSIGDSRIDIYAEVSGRKHLMEVKGVTLEKNGIVLFPDAPTERGVKHVRELTKAAGEGYVSSVIFVVQMERADYFEPNYDMHMEFGLALEEAASAGVSVRAFKCRVTPGSMELDSEIPVILGHS